MDDRSMDAIARDWDVPRLNEAAGIDPRWLHAFVALRFADILAQVAIGDRLHLLPAKDRAYLKAQTETLVVDVIEHYKGWQ